MKIKPSAWHYKLYRWSKITVYSLWGRDICYSETQQDFVSKGTPLFKNRINICEYLREILIYLPLSLTIYAFLAFVSFFIISAFILTSPVNLGISFAVLFGLVAIVAAVATAITSLIIFITDRVSRMSAKEHGDDYSKNKICVLMEIEK